MRDLNSKIGSILLVRGSYLASESVVDEIIALVRDDIYNNHETLQRWKEDIAREQTQRCIEAIDDTTYSREIKDGMIKALEKQE